jgi:hypothetical protein
MGPCVVTEDLTARVAGLAATIEAGLAADEAVALAPFGDDVDARSWTADKGGYPDALPLVDDGWGRTIVYGHATTPAVAAHIARNDPARVLRHVKATRDLVAAILAEGHDYVDGDPWFSCSQATEPGEDDSEPGSACADDERRGKPCDCGRDSRAARLLGIIAGEWEDA